MVRWRLACMNCNENTVRTKIRKNYFHSLFMCHLTLHSFRHWRLCIRIIIIISIGKMKSRWWRRRVWNGGLSGTMLRWGRGRENADASGSLSPSCCYRIRSSFKHHSCTRRFLLIVIVIYMILLLILRSVLVFHNKCGVLSFDSLSLFPRTSSPSILYMP